LPHPTPATFGNGAVSRPAPHFVMLSEVGLDRLLKDADLALYRAKGAGRDKVVKTAWLPELDEPPEGKPDCDWQQRKIS